jgi:succinoglycan biosynthesis protein ExoO
MKKLISSSGAIYVGEVDDIDNFLSDIAVVLSPIRIGGGVRLKILESLSKGKVVIANKISSEGISDKTVLIVEDSPINIASKIKDLFSDSNKFYEIQYRAWKYARDFHSIGVTTIELLESFCNESDLK